MPKLNNFNVLPFHLKALNCSDTDKFQIFAFTNSAFFALLCAILLLFSSRVEHVSVALLFSVLIQHQIWHFKYHSV